MPPPPPTYSWDHDISAWQPLPTDKYHMGAQSQYFFSGWLDKHIHVHIQCVFLCKTDLFPENWLSMNLLLSLPKAMDWSWRSHSPPWSQIGQSRGWFTSKNSITPSLKKENNKLSTYTCTGSITCLVFSTMAHTSLNRSTCLQGLCFRATPPPPASGFL